MTKLFTILSLLTCFSYAVNAGSFILDDYNVVTVEDFSTTSHVDGKVFVGGDLIANQKIDFFGKHLDSPYVGSSLQVAGYVNGNSGISVQGSMEVGSSNTISNNGSAVNNQTITNATSVSHNTTLENTAVSYQAQLTQASTAFKNMETNSSISYQENKNYKLNVDQSLGQNDYAVFDFDDLNNFFTNTGNQEAEILANNIDDIAGIVINVSGTTLEQAQNNKASGTIFNNFREKILWNFYEATTITLGTSNFMGTLLAPLATVTAMGDIDGSVGAYSLITTREIHLEGTVITPPTTVKVDEPATLLMFAFAVIVLVRRFSIK